MGDYADDAIDHSMSCWMDEYNNYDPEEDEWHGDGAIVSKRVNNKSVNQKQTNMASKEQEKQCTRSFYAKIAVVGPSGSGKSYMSKTAPHEDTGFINVERKPLPFKQELQFKFMGQPKTWGGYIKNIKDYAENPEVKRLFIDSQTGAFTLLNQEMRTNFTGWDVAKNYNRQVYEYFELLKNIQKDVIILSHDEMVKVAGETSALKRMAVHNKEYEGKIEREFVCVLYTGSRIKNSKPEYYLRTFEEDTSAKTPEGLFAIPGESTPLEIPNDAGLIYEAVEQYYCV